MSGTPLTAKRHDNRTAALLSERRVIVAFLHLGDGSPLVRAALARVLAVVDSSIELPETATDDGTSNGAS